MKSRFKSPYRVLSTVNPKYHDFPPRQLEILRANFFSQIYVSKRNLVTILMVSSKFSYAYQFPSYTKKTVFFSENTSVMSRDASSSSSAPGEVTDPSFLHPALWCHNGALGGCGRVRVVAGGGGNKDISCDVGGGQRFKVSCQGGGVGGRGSRGSSLLLITRLLSTTVFPVRFPP